MTKQPMDPVSDVLNGYPVPAQLATPTDLSPDDVRAITASLNPLVATAFALYVKTKNFHWHLATTHFRDYHLMLDEQADAIFATIDVLAERVRRVGGTTLRSIGHIGKLQIISDDDDDWVTPHAMIERLIEDNKNFTRAMRQSHGVMEAHKDVATASILEIYIDESERRTWFLYETGQRDADDQR